MTVMIEIDEALEILSQLVDRAAAGEEIVIARKGTPQARLVPLERQPGGWEGQVTIADDFDAPLPDEVVRGFEGRDS